jgi:hypothetical protein
MTNQPPETRDLTGSASPDEKKDTPLRLYTCLNVTLPAGVALGGRTNLWITASRKSEALALLSACGVSYREETFAGPVQAGQATAGVQHAGLTDQAAVYAYPLRWEPSTPVMRIDSPTSSTAVATMGGVMPHLVSR